MRNLDVDIRSAWEPPRWAWGLVGLLFVVAGGLGAAAWHQSEQLKALKAERESLMLQRAAASSPRFVPVEKKPYDASAREMLALATSDWPAMLTALESAEVAGVLPTSLELVAGERWIRVEVEFPDYAKLLEYIDALNAGEPRPKWHLVQAQSASSGPVAAPVTPYTATIKGTW